MEKLLGLLHEGTIINTRMLWILVSRYKMHFFISLLFFIGLVTYHYKTQPTINVIKVPLKTITSHKISTDLSSLLPVDNSNSVTLEELQITLTSPAFLNNVAIEIVKDKNFSNLNFANLKSKKAYWGRDLIQACATSSVKDCINASVSSKLKDLFLIERGLTENRFSLVVSTVEKNTANVLARVLPKEIEKDRIKIRQYTILKEINNVGSLIEESRSMMKSMGGYAAIEEHEKLQNNIADLKERIKMLQYNSSLEMANATSLEAKLAENKRTTRENKKPLENYDSILKAHARLNEVKLNLNSLTLIPESDRTASDRLIISQLVQEQKRLLKIVPEKDFMKVVAHSESFKEKQFEISGNYKFDYLVSKNKIAKLKEDYELAKKELNSLMQKKLAAEVKVNGMKSDLDFLKNLESKMMSLKLLSATMNSDLIFEDIDQEAREFKSASLGKIVLFGFLMTLFLYLISIFIRFFLDDRIYGEEDIRLYFKGLDFVGEVPSFD